MTQEEAEFILKKKARVKILQGVLVVIVSLTAVFSFGGFILQSQVTANDELKLKTTLDCIRTWADLASDRTTALTGPNAKVQKALFDLINTLSLPRSQQPEAFRHALFDPKVGYLATYRANASNQQDHPAPIFNC